MNINGSCHKWVYTTINRSNRLNWLSTLNSNTTHLINALYGLACHDPSPFMFNSNLLISLVFGLTGRARIAIPNLDESIFMYDEMTESGIKTDDFRYPMLLKACAKLSALKEGMEIYGHIFSLQQVVQH